MGRHLTDKSWQEIAKGMQDYRAKTINEVKPEIPSLPHKLPKNVTKLPREFLSEKEIWITETEPTRLASVLCKGELTAVEVTKAFLRRAGLASRLVREQVSFI